MTEWRLFEEGAVPVFTTQEFFAAHPWISPAHQIGHAERMQMVLQAYRDLSHARATEALTDLGCGDGSFLELLRASGEMPPVRAWGYDAGTGNVEVARQKGLDVRQANILTDELEYGDIITVTEVIEHLLDPHTFLRSLPSKYLIATSPSAETDEWHYEHHAWAWDIDGYSKLLHDAGWMELRHYECFSKQMYDHGTGFFQPLRFQAIVASRIVSST